MLGENIKKKIFLQSTKQTKKVRKGGFKTNNSNLKYLRYWLKPYLFGKVWKKWGKRKRWLKKVVTLRRWRRNRRSAKVWKRAFFLNTYKVSSRYLKVLKDYSTKKILLDFLSWKLGLTKNRIRFLVNVNFKRRGLGQDHVTNLLYNVLARWDSILFYTGLVKNRAICAKLITDKGLIINGKIVEYLADLNHIIQVGDSLEVNYKKKTYFRRRWCRRNRRVWPAVFEYSRRAKTWILYRKLNYAIIAKHQPQILRFLAYPLLIERVLGRLRY